MESYSSIWTAIRMATTCAPTSAESVLSDHGSTQDTPKSGAPAHAAAYTTIDRSSRHQKRRNSVLAPGSITPCAVAAGQRIKPAGLGASEAVPDGILAVVSQSSAGVRQISNWV
jgi:hypothetical protein